MLRGYDLREARTLWQLEGAFLTNDSIPEAQLQSHFEPGGDRITFWNGRGVTVVNLASGASFFVGVDWESDPEAQPLYVAQSFTADGARLCVGNTSASAIVDLAAVRPLPRRAGLASACLHRGRPHAVVVTVPLPRRHVLVQGAGEVFATFDGYARDDVVVDATQSLAVALTRSPSHAGPATERALLIVSVASGELRRRVDLGPGPTKGAGLSLDGQTVTLRIAGSPAEPTTFAYDLATGAPASPTAPAPAPPPIPEGPVSPSPVPLRSTSWLQPAHVNRSTAAVRPGAHFLDGDGVSVRRRGTGTLDLSQDGQRLAILIPFDSGRVMARLEDGRVDWLLGEPQVKDGLGCRLGDHFFPYAVCADRWREDGALAQALAAE